MNKKQKEMITGFYKKPEKNEYYIWIKRYKENTKEIYYSKVSYDNSDFYSSMMKKEFNKKKHEV